WCAARTTPTCRRKTCWKDKGTVAAAIIKQQSDSKKQPALRYSRCRLLLYAFNKDVDSQITVYRG
ncbi:hypothetical protein, partial [Kingella denitrificans]|uniref:hypothetical protein n=1 Tax=Kingella denitrificans TaxID=502 RepID=UPI00288A1374